MTKKTLVIGFVIVILCVELCFRWQDVSVYWLGGITGGMRIQFVEKYENKSQLTEWGKFASKITIPFLVGIGTILVIGLALMQLANQKDIANKTLRHTQFKEAIEHLGHKEQSVILGGIHALHNLATIDPSYQKQVLNILCSFIRIETTKPGYKELIRVTNLRNRAERLRDVVKIAQYNEEIKVLLSNKDNRIVSTQVIQTIINLLFRKPEDHLRNNRPLNNRKKTTYFFPRRCKTIRWR